jgi:C-terminal processing protease CtpA/Prc
MGLTVKSRNRFWETVSRGMMAWVLLAALPGWQKNAADGDTSAQPSTSGVTAAGDSVISENRSEEYGPFGLMVKSLSKPHARTEGGEVEHGMVVIGVMPGSVADKAGIQAGDLIEEMNRISIYTSGDFKHAEGRTKEGQGVPVLVHRGDKTFLTGFLLRPDTLAGS